MFNIKCLISYILPAEVVHLTTIADSYGTPLAEYYFFPDQALLYVT